MAAVSNAPTMTASSATALTPPTSSHGNGYSWDSSPQHLEGPPFSQKTLPKSQSLQPDGPLTYTSANIHLDQLGHGKLAAADFGPNLHGQENVRQARARDTSNGQVDRALDLQDFGRNGTATDLSKSVASDALVGELDDVSSKWIHRDKLARIENEELQAAGIILPKHRGRSKPRRDASQEKPVSYRKALPESDATAEPRSRKNSAGFADGKPTDAPLSGWDLRLPEEIAEESYFVTAYGSGGRGSSRIPVAKLSPAPIALEHIERDTPMIRRRDSSPAMQESIAYPKLRARSASMRLEDDSTRPTPTSPQRNMTRSASDLSPKKASSTAHAGSSSSTAGSRKASAPSKSTSTAGHPKTRNGGASKDSNSSSTGITRPSTRSGDRELSREIYPGAANKQPEGEPPWMISAYRPDPRLPPDQQLLPTVARRLQQEKWEREGKFGNVYDKEFRPLTDEGFLSPPEPSEKTAGSAGQAPEMRDEWPLKPDAKTSTSHTGRAGSYSTIPRIQDKPNMSPLPSPRGPLPHPTEVSTSQSISRVQDENAGVKRGCGCCILM